MAWTLRWTGPALEDIQAIATHIERDSPYYASQVALELFDAAQAIPDFPHRGRMVPEYQRADLRELLVGAYRLIYWLQEPALVVLAVMHTSRDLPAAFRDRLPEP
ncbi:MAG: type II toxin-antitoxin system RelE/ParE family toxin [Chloroflexi bacterium]|nr:type II toxin-antitoxin system RelE/ParE family toxin [Chloroflexota bacterium]